MKKICFFLNDLSGKGGTERVTSVIANELSKYYEVIIISIQGQEPFFSFDSSIKLISLNRKVKSYISIVRNLRQKLLEEKVDLIIEVDSILKIYTFLALIFLDIKSITWEHFNFYNPKGIKKRDIARWLAGKTSNKIITLTEEDRKYYIKELKLNEEKVISIYNPVSFEEIKIEKNKDKICISVGRLCNQKGFDRLINIWEKAKILDWKLKIIGSGADEKKLKKMIEEKNIKNIEMIESTSNINKYYNEASLFLMTSRYEGLPLVLIEAQSYGIPVISYDIKTGPRDIIIDGKNGCLVEDGNEVEFISKLHSLVNNFCLRNNFSKKSIENTSKFDRAPIVKKWLEIIEEIIGENK